MKSVVATMINRAIEAFFIYISYNRFYVFLSLTFLFIFISITFNKNQEEYDYILKNNFEFANSWVKSLDAYERGQIEPNLSVYESSHVENISEKFGELIQDENQSPKYSHIPILGNNTPAFEFELIPFADSFTARYDPSKYENKSDYVNFYFEVDNNPKFNSTLSVRYPSLTPNYVSGSGDQYQFDVYNLSNVTLNLFHAGHKRMFLDGRFDLPFSTSVYLARIPENRDMISLKELEQVSYLLSQRPTEIENHKQIFQFVKLNHVWGGDKRTRKPVESFVVKTVGCGHMNSVAGLLIELSGGRYRLVSGFDPYVRPFIPGGGHTAIEVYSETLGWGYLDTFLDIYAPEISAENIKGSKIADTHIYTKKLEGKDYIVNLERLFRFRIYGDQISRRALLPMTYLIGNEKQFGTKWKTTTINPSSLSDIKKEAVIYVRGRYVRSNCPINFLDNLNNCTLKKVEVSDWTTKSYKITAR